MTYTSILDEKRGDVHSATLLLTWNPNRSERSSGKGQGGPFGGSFERSRAYKYLGRISHAAQRRSL